MSDFISKADSADLLTCQNLRKFNPIETNSKSNRKEFNNSKTNCKTGKSPKMRARTASTVYSLKANRLKPYADFAALRAKQSQPIRAIASMGSICSRNLAANGWRSLTVRISGCGPLEPGSTPGAGLPNSFPLSKRKCFFANLFLKGFSSDSVHHH